ncbi:MAG: sigma-70 family RNA polymerase sigma factor [Saprospiraceae bacterium]
MSENSSEKLQWIVEFIFCDVEVMVSVEITRMLQEWSAGDESALRQLVPMVYSELRRTAQRHMRKERPGITMQTTALVNEVYLRLVNITNVEWRDRAHFFAIAAQMMRRILVDAARARASGRRGGEVQRVGSSTPYYLDNVPDVSTTRDGEMIAIDDALQALAQMDPRKARVIELRFFGGLSVEETAEILKISPQSVLRDWKLAKIWLGRELRKG